MQGARSIPPPAESSSVAGSYRMIDQPRPAHQDTDRPRAADGRSIRSSMEQDLYCPYHSLPTTNPMGDPGTPYH
jgi:hypothetical protein